MIKFGSFTIGDWQQGNDDDRWYRYVTNKNQSYDISSVCYEDDDEIRVELAYQSKNKSPSISYWVIIFYGCFELCSLHKEMFKETYDYDYPSKEEAMQHVDLFLDKLQKMKVFL